MLGRLPLPQAPSEIGTLGETILLMDMLQSVPVAAQQIEQWTGRDPVMSAVHSFVLKGWPNKIVDMKPEDIKPYQNRKSELSLHAGCLMWGNRVVVPPPGRSKLMEQLHDCHPGMSRMKNLARSSVWWPGIDQDIKDTVKTCIPCQRARHLPPPVTPTTLGMASSPLGSSTPRLCRTIIRSHVFYFGGCPLKWMEVKAVKTATSTTTIEHLRNIFTTHGLPEMLVTDNASYFTSQEFHGIRHVTFLKKSPSDSLQTRLSRFLLQYRITPHSTTGTSPTWT